MLLIAGSILLLTAVSFASGVWLSRRGLDPPSSQATAQPETDRAEILSDAERERDFFLRFAREFPELTQRLHSQVDTRSIPIELTKILVRSFHPWQAVVVLRRHKVTSEPERNKTLTVAEVARHQPGLEKGTEIELGIGELGFVAQSQRVMAREDFDALPEDTRTSMDSDLESTFDLAAPMIFDGQTLGVLAVSRPNLRSESSKAVFGLIAHMGAMALQNAAAYRKLKLFAEIDGLTGLYNKTFVHEALTEKIADCVTQNTQLSVLLLDVDHFKNYNDVNGHDEGDRLLKEFAQVMTDNIRDTSILGRYGGEEFLLILPGVDGESAAKAAENVRRKVAAHDFRFKEKQPLGMLSFSGGVASFPDSGGDVNELIRAADDALYEAKRAGRNRVLRAKPGPPRDLDEDTPVTLEFERVLTTTGSKG